MGEHKIGLYQKLLNIRKSVEYLQKTETGNKGAKFVDPAVLLKKIRDEMNNQQVLLMPCINEATVESFAAPTQNNKEAKSFLFKSSMTYVFVDAETGQQELIPWFITGKHMQDPAMAEGGALTYGERYFLLKFFQIPTSKDDPEFFENKTSVKISEKDLISLREIVESKGYSNNYKNVLSQYAVKIAKIGSIANLPASRLESAKEFFNAMAEKE